MINDFLKLPGSSASWVERASIVAVAKMAPSHLVPEVHPGQPTPEPIVAINFQLRLVDGKSINIQTTDRNEMKEFLKEIGIEWD